MKRKILGILICILLIATTIPVVTPQDDSAVNILAIKIQQISKDRDWTEIQKLLASDGAQGDSFGGSVSLDGDTALIGASWDDDNGDHSGSAYVFTWTGSTWSQQAKLLASDGGEGDIFGCSASLSGDTALIGACWDEDNGFSSGSAYVFTRTGSTWTQQAKIVPPDGDEEDHFGESVSLNGNTALIGAPSDDENGDFSGSAYLYHRTGTIWTQQAKLLASDGIAHDRFGISVSLDGDTALIGAYLDDENGEDTGSAYVFQHIGLDWIQKAKLLASDSAIGDWFGLSVSLDGDTALIGAPGDDDNGAWSGSAYVFTRTGDAWTQQAKLTASDGEAEDWFALSVSLDGDTALIGARFDDENGEDSGSAYVFTRTSNTWSQQAKLTASDGAVEDWFSSTVSLDGDTALIGASRNDDNGPDTGSAYIFTKENHPPEKPDQPSGETNGNINTPYTYTTKTIDSDGDEVYYMWDWDDGSQSTWIGPFDSGDDATAEHTWSTKGDYSIKVKAKDTSDAESDWSDPLPVTMPCSYNIPMQWFWDRFFQRFSNAFPILRHLMGY